MSVSLSSNDQTAATESGPQEERADDFSWLTALWATWFVVSLIQTKLNKFLPNQEKYLGYAAVGLLIMSVLENRHEKRAMTGAWLGPCMWSVVVACALVTHSTAALSNGIYVTILMFCEWMLPSRRRSSIRILFLLAEGLLVAGVALIPVLPQFVFGSSVTRIVEGGTGFRFDGMGFHPNDLAPFALMATICVAGQTRLNPVRRILTLVCGLISLFLTESRFVWIVASVLLAMLVTSIVTERNRLQSRWLVAVPLLGILFTVPLAQYLLPRVSVEELTSSNGRLTVWRFVANHWRENMVFGHGAGIFAQLRDNALPRWAWHAHNVFLQELFLRGIVGLVLFVIILILLLIRGVQRYLKDPVLLLATVSVLGTGYMNVVYAPEYLNVSTLGVILTLAVYWQSKELE